jgi:methylenetetrahydrofolate reductase (NADPH)
MESASMQAAGGAALAELLRSPRFEVFPSSGIEDEVVEHLSNDVKVTVTSSPKQGIETTVQLSAELARRGFEVVPHVSARLVQDEKHLHDILQGLHDVGVHDIFVIGGDVKEPVGKFAGAFDLLTTMADLGHGFDQIGIAGYPESHPFISDEMTIRAMSEKASLATYIVSQLCFEPRIIDSWVAAVRERGVSLPIYIGLPGVVPRRKLVRLSMKIGVGESARFLRKHGNVVAPLLLRGSYGPGDLIEGLAPHVGDARKIGGFHFFTFNELVRTERWRQQAIRRLGRPAGRAAASTTSRGRTSRA